MTKLFLMLNQEKTRDFTPLILNPQSIDPYLHLLLFMMMLRITYFQELISPLMKTHKAPGQQNPTTEPPLLILRQGKTRRLET